MTFGCLGVSLEGPGLIFHRFGVPFWERLGHHFQKNRALDIAFSTYVFGIVPGGIFNGFWVPPGASRRGKSIEIHATVVKNQGLKELRTRWVWVAARVDFSWILESVWEALGHFFSFVGVLERGLTFDDFPGVPLGGPNRKT